MAQKDKRYDQMKFGYSRFEVAYGLPEPLRCSKQKASSFAGGYQFANSHFN